MNAGLAKPPAPSIVPDYKEVSMSEPVEVGGGLDKVHLPQPNQFYRALALAQAKMTSATLALLEPWDLRNVLAVVLPPLNAEGICLSQAVVRHEPKDYVETRLAHEKGDAHNVTPVMVTEPTAAGYRRAVDAARLDGVCLLLGIAPPVEKAPEGAAAPQEIPKAFPALKPSDLAKATKIIEEAVAELIEAATEGRFHGIEEIWSELPSGYVRDQVFAKIGTLTPTAISASIMAVIMPKAAAPTVPAPAAQKPVPKRKARRRQQGPAKGTP